MEQNKFLFKGTYTSGTDPWRYRYRLNYTDQTVSVIDHSSNTVIATITLTAGKSMRNILYRPINRSVYVIANAWFDRIDADPASGTFNTVVQSAAFTTNTNAGFVKYSPVFDCLMNSNQTFEFASSGAIDLAPAGSYPRLSMFPDILTNNNRNRVLQQMMDTIGFYAVEWMPRANIIFMPHLNGGNQCAAIKYALKEGSLRMMPVSHRTIAMGIGIANRVGNFFYNTDIDSTSQLYSWSINQTDRIASKFLPIVNKIVTYQRISSNTSLTIIDWATKTVVGNIIRTAYQDTGENMTKQVSYCPYNGFFYVEGHNHASGGTVAKIHYYNPALALASMYLGTINVGNGGTHPDPYFENSMCMNGCEIWEFDDPIK